MAQELSLAKHMKMAFATPVVVYEWPESEALNAELKEIILAAEKESPGIERSNVGGWHSENDFLNWPHEAVKTLAGRVGEMARALTKATGPRKAGRYSVNVQLRGWSTVMRSGDYHHAHSHPNSMWSGVYYVADGKPEPEPKVNGRLELLDPRAGVDMLELPGKPFSARFRLDPKSGVMVVFPSWLKHFVHPFHGAEERIAVSFNVLMTGLKTLDD